MIVCIKSTLNPRMLEEHVVIVTYLAIRNFSKTFDCYLAIRNHKCLQKNNENVIASYDVFSMIIA